MAIKIAPFNRYQTIDVVRALAESGRANEVALYTGNDDNILNDLSSVFDFNGQRIRFAGGLLGHWAVWTRVAVEHLAKVKAARESIPANCTRWPRRSPMRMPPYSIPRTTFMDAFLAFTKSFDGRDCSKDAGVSIPRRNSHPDRWKKSTASARHIRIFRTTRS